MQDRLSDGRSQAPRRPRAATPREEAPGEASDSQGRIGTGKDRRLQLPAARVMAPLHPRAGRSLCFPLHPWGLGGYRRLGAVLVDGALSWPRPRLVVLGGRLITPCGRHFTPCGRHFTPCRRLSTLCRWLITLDRRLIKPCRRLISPALPIKSVVFGTIRSGAGYGVCGSPRPYP